MSLFDLAFLFARVGVVSFGGGSSSLAELQHELVDRSAALTQQQFQTAYALGQATPGPGVLFLVPMGFYVAGAPGAIVTLIAFLLPPLLIQVVVASQWERLSRSPWIRALDRTLVALSVGLIAASLNTLVAPMLGDLRALIAVLVIALLVIRLRPAPAVIVLGAGLLGLLGVL